MKSHKGTADFSVGILQAGNKRHDIYTKTFTYKKMLKGKKNLQPGILYLERLLFIIEREAKIILHKVKGVCHH